MANGWGRLVTKRGEAIDGFFVDGQLQVFARIVYKDGSHYEGCIVNKMKSGRGIFTDKSRMVTESIWKDEQASGNTKIKDAEGKVHFEGTIVDGMRTGFCSFWDK